MSNQTDNFFNTLTSFWKQKSKRNNSHPKPNRKERCPVYIITGFLGSGKTTCINQILQSANGINFGVIVNDFGSVCIDQHLISGEKGQVIALENGCICCSLRTNLSESIIACLASESMPDILVIEASGVAEPAGIINVLESEELKKKIRIGGVICLVDAEGIQSISWIMSHLVRKQIKSADLILINKTDRVSESVLSAVRKEWIPQEIPTLETIKAAIPISLIFETSHTSGRDISSGEGPLEHHHHHNGEEHGFSTISWTSKHPVRLSCLQSLLKSLPTSIIRAKGLVYLKELPGQRAVIQVVGKRVSVTKGHPWAEEQPSSILTFIGTENEIQKYNIQKKLQSCLVEPEMH